jgi:hypothetical protein
VINWAAVAAVAAICGVLVTVIGVAFTTGKVLEKMATDSERVDGVVELQKEQGEKLGEHGLEIDRLKQWRMGFQAAANVSGSVRDGE